METTCTKCSSPVTIPDDVGVAACKTCGKLAGRYCPDCNLAIPKPNDACSGCGRSYAACLKRKRTKALWKVLKYCLWIFLALLPMLLGGWKELLVAFAGSGAFQ